MNDSKAYRFARHQRLLSPKAFDTVYRKGARASTVHLSARWLACTSLSLAESAQSEKSAKSAKSAVTEGRLGVTVAKRLLRRAVDRNAVKRVVREAFRKHPAANSSIDLVVGLSSVKNLAKPRTKRGKRELKIEIEKLLKLQQQKNVIKPTEHISVNGLYRKDESQT